MPQPSPGPSELDVRLAEIDRRLQEIQAGLAPDAEAAGPALTAADAPPPSGEPAEPSPSPRSGPLATLLSRTRRRRGETPGEEVAELVRMHNGLLDAVGQLAQLLGQRAAGADADADPRGAALVSAGPFGDTRQVESFVLSLAALEPVHEAVVIGYEGADRALIEVQLSDPSG
jgi:hypothetical protein